MQKKKCLFCGMPVEKEWSFCPQCGRPLRTQGINISGLNIDVTKMVNELIPQVLNGVFNGSIFTNKQQESQHSHESGSKQSFSAKEIIEPEDLVSKHGDTIARPQPTIAQGAGSGIIQSEIPFEHIWTPDEQFSYLSY